MMDGSSNADSDHSLTWEDFFGSATDLSPTLIGIYDSLLEPSLKATDPEFLKKKTKDSKQSKRDEGKRKMATPLSSSPSKDPRLIAGSVRLPGLSNEAIKPSTVANPPLQIVNRDIPQPSKSSYVSRLKSFALRKNSGGDSLEDNTENLGSSSEISSAQVLQSRISDKKMDNLEQSAPKVTSDQVKVIAKLNSEVIAKVESNRKHFIEKAGNSANSFENLSPNVKRMLCSAGAETPVQKPSIVQHKKPSLNNIGRSSYRSAKQSNIPLMGATSKITQSGVDIISTADIYDKPLEHTSSLTRINVNATQHNKIPTISPSPSNSSFVSPIKSSFVNRVTKDWSASEKNEMVRDKATSQSDLDDGTGSVYDVPINSSSIYDVPVSPIKPVQIESLALPFIDQQSETVNSKSNEHLNQINQKNENNIDSGDISMLDLSNNINNEVESNNSVVSDDKINTIPPSLSETPVKHKPDSLIRQGNIFDNEISFVTNNSRLYSDGSGSTGNLKISNQDSRLDLPNSSLVTRPLSMSSIASSSSTSSSGAQNKGGVNSAYLASIESLDDNSDIDNAVVFAKNARLVQANGNAIMSRDMNDGGVAADMAAAASLVRPPTPPRPRYCDPSLSLLQRVCTEIVDTENIYVEDLRQVVEGYLYTWRERGTFAPEQLRDLFSNIEEIYHFNRTFSHQLNECNLEPVSIARCFVRHSGGFSIYTRYCTGYPGTMATMARLVAAPTSAQPFRSRQAALGHALPLGSYLLKPVQRILKYHLLLQNLVKQCTSHDTEYALYKMTGIAQHIDDMKGRHEHAVRVQEIQSLLYGWNGQDLTTYGELCAEGTFRVFGAKAMRHAFLFDKMLLLTKNKEYGILAYKTHIMCNNLMLVESIQGQPLSFHVIPFDCPRMQVTLQARNVRHKREWTLLLKRVILENYNAVIPSHARQLVMELGQNKTDDDMLAEKSATLISHSSMRKQLSAPEYLEKRKLERERRKSFESGLRHRLKRSTARKGQNANGSMEVDEDKDKSVRSDSICDEETCNCYKEQEKCDFCSSNLDDSNLELSKDVCSQCMRSDKHNETSRSNIDLCDVCQYDKDRLAFSDSNCDYEISNMRKCRSCLENCHFQSQSSIDADFKKSQCADCDKSMHFIDGSIGGSVEKSIGRCAKCSESNSSFNLKRHKLGGFKCSSEEVVSSQESSRCNGCLKNNASYQNDLTKKQYDRLDDENGRVKNKESLNVKKTCLKCHEIRENITTDSSNKSKMSDRDNNSSQCEHDDNYTDGQMKRISKDDSQTLTVPKTSGTLRRKSEPGMANINFDPKDWKKSVKNDATKHGRAPSEDRKSIERCQDCGKAFNACINCGKTVTGRKIMRCIHKGVDRKVHSVGQDVDSSSGNIKNESSKQSVPEVKMYNAKTVPKKISKIKKSRAKTLRHYLASDSTAKFYADFSNEFSADNVLHISESTDSINTLNSNKNDEDALDCNTHVSAENLLVDDEELYRSLVQKTDSFKKSEIEKDKLMCAQNEARNSLDDVTEADTMKETSKDGEVDDDAFESCDDGQSEKPLEQIISQLLMQNREFQKILKRHQLRNATNRRHQRLLKSHSNPEKVLVQNRDNQLKLKPKYGRQTSAVENAVPDENIEHLDEVKDDCTDKIDTEYPKQYRRPPVEEHIYETLIVSPDKENTDKDPTDAVVIVDKDYSVPSSQPCLKTFAPKNQRNVSDVDFNPSVSARLDVPSGRQTRVSLTESDYVYLCFEGKKTIDAIDVKDIVKNMQDFEDNGEYAVPNSSPIKVRKPDIERRATKDKIEIKPAVFNNIEENYYDNASEIWKRISNDTVIENPSFKAKTEAFNIDDYLDPENGSQNPNLPEVWLNRQKEHFTTPRDKKSGSLPRSFQVVVNDADQNCILKPVVKPGVYNKVYLNKDGKVLQTDRPFTIASDHSEISYEDIERFIKGEDESALKFPSDAVSSNRSSLFDCDNMDNESVSRSTLELEAEIDRCYKNNFEYNLTSGSNSNLLVSASHIQSMDNSISSSMEVMNDKNESGISQEDISVHHPEHKIYKPNSNVLSLKGVLNRFKSKGRPSQDQQNSDCVTVADKGNGNEMIKSNGRTASVKKTASPKNYSRNLMQRFKSIINDEQFIELEKTGKLAPDDSNFNNASFDTSDIGIAKNDTNIKSNITVLVTNVDESLIKNSDIVLSKSFCETTVPESNIGSPDFVSKSCNDILSPMSLSRDNLNGNNVQGMSQSVQFTPSSNYQSPLARSAHNSVQDLNKLPIYKQGSRHLGARIAQSDYADPKALFMTDSNSELNKVNVLINKNALRPDSLLSNSSHFTSSSEGCLNPNEVASRNSSFLYRNSQSEVVRDKTTAVIKRQTSSTSDQIITKKIQIERFLSLDPNTCLEKHEDKKGDIRMVFKSNADDSFYEKSFEEIENLLGNEIFRDSAIYSDPEDGAYPSENDLEKKYRGFNSGNTLTRHKTEMSNASFKINKTVVAANDDTIDSITAPALAGSQENILYINATANDTDNSISRNKPDIKVKRTSSVHEKTTEIEKIIIANGKNNELEHSSKISNNSDIKTQKLISNKNISGVKLAPPVPAKPTYKSSSTSKATSRIISNEKISSLNESSGCSMKLSSRVISQDQGVRTDERMQESDSKLEKLTCGKLHVMLKLPDKSAISAPSLRSPTEKLKLSIPRLNYERSTSSNIQIKRMSFERSSLDSSKINKRSRSVSSYETTENSLAKDVNEDQVIVKSVQERRKEIEMMNSNVSVAERKHGNVDEVKNSSHRKSADGLEHSSIAFSRSISVKTTAYDNSNSSAKDQSRIISKKNIPILKVPLQKCNIPIVNSSSKQNISTEINSVNVDTIDLKNGATFEEKPSLSDNVVDLKDTEVTGGASSNLLHRGQSAADVEKGGWVKHVVNRFQ